MPRVNKRKQVIINELDKVLKELAKAADVPIEAWRCIFSKLVAEHMKAIPKRSAEIWLFQARSSILHIVSSRTGYTISEPMSYQLHTQYKVKPSDYKKYIKPLEDTGLKRSANPAYWCPPMEVVAFVKPMAKAVLEVAGLDAGYAEQVINQRFKEEAESDVVIQRGGGRCHLTVGALPLGILAFLVSYKAAHSGFRLDFGSYTSRIIQVAYLADPNSPYAVRKQDYRDAYKKLSAGCTPRIIMSTLPGMPLGNIFEDYLQNVMKKGAYTESQIQSFLSPACVWDAGHGGTKGKRGVVDPAAKKFWNDAFWTLTRAPQDFPSWGKRSAFVVSCQRGSNDWAAGFIPWKIEELLNIQRKAQQVARANPRRLSGFSFPRDIASELASSLERSVQALDSCVQRWGGVQAFIRGIEYFGDDDDEAITL